MRSNIAITYIRLFKIVRTCNIQIMDHEIISPDIDGSCDVYSSLICNPLDENGLMTCFYIDSLCIIYFPIYCVTFIVNFTLLLLLQKYIYNNH